MDFRCSMHITIYHYLSLSLFTKNRYDKIEFIEGINKWWTCPKYSWGDSIFVGTDLRTTGYLFNCPSGTAKHLPNVFWSNAPGWMAGTYFRIHMLMIIHILWPRREVHVGTSSHWPARSVQTDNGVGIRGETEIADWWQFKLHNWILIFNFAAVDFWMRGQWTQRDWKAKSNYIWFCGWLITSQIRIKL